MLSQHVNFRNAARSVINGLIAGGHVAISEGRTDDVIASLDDALLAACEQQDAIVIEAEKRIAGTKSNPGIEGTTLGDHVALVARDYGVDMTHEAFLRQTLNLLLEDENVEEVYADDSIIEKAAREILERVIPTRRYDLEPTLTECPNCGAPSGPYETLFIDGEKIIVCPECRNDSVGLARTCKTCGQMFTELIDGECVSCREKAGKTIPTYGEFICYVNQAIYDEDELAPVSYLGAQVSREAALKMADDGDYKFIKWASQKGYRFCSSCRAFVESRTLRLPEGTDEFDPINSQNCGCGGKNLRK